METALEQLTLMERYDCYKDIVRMKKNLPKS